jgi:hypothetical protein
LTPRRKTTAATRFPSARAPPESTAYFPASRVRTCARVRGGPSPAPHLGVPCLVLVLGDWQGAPSGVLRLGISAGTTRNQGRQPGIGLDDRRDRLLALLRRHRPRVDRLQL